MNATTLHYADQLTTLLRSLRKRRKLTQAQLGDLLGVSQARVAELEAKPGVVGVGQMIKVLAALGGTLQLTVHDDQGAGQAPALQPADGVPLPEGPAQNKSKRTAFKLEAAGEHRVSEPKPPSTSTLPRHGKTGSW